MKLWNGRIEGSLDADAAVLNRSLGVDCRMALVDVTGSQAWARASMLAGVLTPFEAEQILLGLDETREELVQDRFAFDDGDEDIHTAVERRLTELIGPLAGKLHTGRSRNDQVATDFRLWLLGVYPTIENGLKQLQTVLVDCAERDRMTVMPGFTHTRQAQPISVGHWWLAHFWALERDRQRLLEFNGRTAVLPLGSGALAGTPYAINRFALAADLGFAEPSPNSLDAVSDRDFAAEFLFWAALVGVHLSRMADALILFTTPEFGYFNLPDAFSTGSSLMPQKKNPDPLELIRGKSGLLTGRLAGMLATLKGLPSAYDKDLQEDKAPVFDSADLVARLLSVMAGLLSELEPCPERMRAAVDSSTLATDLADYLVRKGVPFRQAHQAVGQAVRKAEQMGVKLAELPLEDWKQVHIAFDRDVYQAFDVDAAVARRSAFGGTAPVAVAEQIRLAREKLR